MVASTHIRLGLILAALIAPCLGYPAPHPVRVDEHSSCLECHADHAAADHVHPAVQQGCTSCHRVENREDEAYVVLKPANSVLCFECHQPETPVRVHFPYASAMCTRCHDPHGSANPKLLRAKVNDLCLTCHLQNPERVPSRSLPTIALTRNNTVGHPYERHPVSGAPDPLRNEEISCISCHLPHGGTKLHYLKMGSEIPEDALNQNTETNDMCHKCHLILWGLDDNTGKKSKKKNGTR